MRKGMILITPLWAVLAPCPSGSRTPRAPLPIRTPGTMRLRPVLRLPPVLSLTPGLAFAPSCTTGASSVSMLLEYGFRIRALQAAPIAFQSPSSIPSVAARAIRPLRAPLSMAFGRSAVLKVRLNSPLGRLRCLMHRLDLAGCPQCYSHLLDWQFVPPKRDSLRI